MKYVRKLRCRLDYCDTDQDPDPIPMPQTHAHLLRQLKGQIKRVRSFSAWMLTVPTQT